jgi:transposase
MAKSVSEDLRERLITAVKAGLLRRAAAERLGVSAASAVRGGVNGARRKTWATAQPDLDPERLVFIDEAGASTKMARRYGRATLRLFGSSFFAENTRPYPLLLR